MIILLIGKKQTGKDTVANYLLSNYKDFHQVSFAEPMRRFVKDVFHWDDAWINQHKEDIDPEWGISYREVMQQLGTEFFQIFLPSKYEEFQKQTGRNIWVKSAIKKIKALAKEKQNIVISDCRFPHEFTAIHNLFASDTLCLKLERSITEKKEDNHLSEKELEQIPAHYTIENNGTPEELFQKIDVLLERESLSRNRLIAKKES